MKKVFIKLLIIGLLGLIGLNLTGCGKRIPVSTPTYTWDAQQNGFAKSLKKEESSNLVIGIVDSETTTNGSEQFKKALSLAISEIISAKGFKLKGPYQTFDDITYRDKKMIYLAFRPKLDMQLKHQKTKEERHQSYYHEEGVYTAEGSLEISVVEPMTGQVFIKRRIDLSGLGLSEKYIYEQQIMRRGMTSAMLNAALAPEQLQNTTKYAQSKLEAEVYSAVVDKIQQYIDREELISFEPDILKLKGLKRF